MTLLKIVPFYAALLAFILISLSFRVIKLRRKYQIAIGDGGIDELSRAISAHNNFSQYVPLALLLLMLNELQNVSAIWLNSLYLLLLIGRIIHAYGISQVTENLQLRKTGMIMTFLALLLSAITLILLTLHSLLS